MAEPAPYAEPAPESAGLDLGLGMILLLIGGVLLIIGPFLAFATVSAFGFSMSITGMDLAQHGGSIYPIIYGGMVMGVLAILLGFMKNAKMAMLMGLLGFVFYLVAVIKLMSDASGTGASIGIGAILALVGGILAIIGAKMSA